MQQKRSLSVPGSGSPPGSCPHGNPRVSVPFLSHPIVTNTPSAARIGSHP